MDFYLLSYNSKRLQCLQQSAQEVAYTKGKGVLKTKGKVVTTLVKRLALEFSIGKERTAEVEQLFDLRTA